MARWKRQRRAAVHKFRLFFSHKTSEKPRVQELQSSLKQLLPNLPFEDASSEVPHADDWKATATAVLESCSGVVCFVGEDTHGSEPVDWEIREAHRLGKPLVVTSLSDCCPLPAACKDLHIESAPWDANEVAGRIGELLVPRALFRNHDWSKGAPDATAIWIQYNLMVQSWLSRRALP